MSATAEDRRAVQLAEYGTYVAAEVIFLDGVRAFNEGDAVPVSHVDRGVVDVSQVKKINTEKKG